MSGPALRHNEGKPELGQVLWFDLEWLAAHMAAGRAKYPDDSGRPNFMKGGKPDQEYTDAMARHLKAFVTGEEFDGELHTHHLAAVAWNALALLTLNRNFGSPLNG